MSDPGYGPNGQRLEVPGLIPWSANSPPVVMTIGDDRWNIWALGRISIPAINQEDDEASTFIYLGGA